MHSRRMRTVRCSNRLLREGGGSAQPGRGVSVRGGICLGGCLPMGCLPRGDPSPLEQNDRCLWEHYLAATTLRSVKIFVLSTLCFRFDLGRPTRAFALRACTLQNGAVAVIFYFLSLIISLSIVNIDDKINLSQTRANLWDTDQVSCPHCCRTM